MRTRADGSPVTFDPCRPVHVVVRPDHEPPGGRALLLEALADLSAATGLQFVDDGTTDEAPTEDRAPTSASGTGTAGRPCWWPGPRPTETTLLSAGRPGHARGRTRSAGPGTTRGT